MNKKEQKSKPDIPAMMQVVRVEKVACRINAPTQEYDPKAPKEFNLTANVQVDDAHKLVMVNLKTIVAADKELKKELASFQIALFYQVKNLDEILIKTGKDTADLPPELIVTMGSIAISTSRGMIAELTNGTYLRDCIIPVVNPQMLTAREERK